MGKEVRPSPDGIAPGGFLKAHISCFVCGIKLIGAVVSVSVWRRGAVRREKRRSDREDVRLPPRSFLQLFPAQVLMSLSEDECRGLRRRRIELVTRLFCDQCHIFAETRLEERCGAASTPQTQVCTRAVMDRKILPQSPCKYLKITPCKVRNQLRRLPQTRRRFLPATPLDEPGLCFRWTFVCGLLTWIKCWSSFVKQQSGCVFFLFCSNWHYLKD